MGLSSNSVIHFTKNLKSLNDILSNNFEIRYCRETLITKNRTFDFLAPMVCFCDIPFSQIIDHIKNYGEYGIGLKKTWAENSGLNPVLYIEKESNLAANFFTHLFEKIGEGKDKFSELNSKEKYIIDIIRYAKNYEGKLHRGGKLIKPKYRFSDEREWRYVLEPDKKHAQIGNVKNLEEPKIKSAKIKLNEKVKKERLTFDPDDISYIIIKKESERNKLISNLENIKGKYPLEQVKRLTSRILSVEQIKTDF